MQDLIKINRIQNHTCIPTDAAQDRRISFAARGLHHLLLSYWEEELDLDDLKQNDPLQEIDSAIAELIAAGYISESDGALLVYETARR